MMILRVQDLLGRQEPLKLQGSLDLSDRFRDSRDATPLGPLNWQLTAQHADRTITLTGELEGQMRLICSRCVDPIEATYAFSFEERFRLVNPDDPSQEDEDEFVPLTEDVIDLDDFLGQEFVVQLPFAPLCSEDCRGLCPSCGTNRNENTCDCRTERFDPRLEALQNWFKSDSK